MSTAPLCDCKFNGSQTLPWSIVNTQCFPEVCCSPCNHSSDHARGLFPQVSATSVYRHFGPFIRQSRNSRVNSQGCISQWLDGGSWWERLQPPVPWERHLQEAHPAPPQTVPVRQSWVSLHSRHILVVLSLRPSSRFRGPLPEHIAQTLSQVEVRGNKNTGKVGPRCDSRSPDRHLFSSLRTTLTNLEL